MTVTGETIKYTFTRWQQMAIKTKERNCCKRFCMSFKLKLEDYYYHCHHHFFK